MYKLLHGQRLMSVHFHLSGNMADCNVKRCITHHNAVRKHSLTLFTPTALQKYTLMHISLPIKPLISVLHTSMAATVNGILTPSKLNLFFLRVISCVSKPGVLF